VNDTDNPFIYFPPPLLFIAALVAGVLVDGNVMTWRHMLHSSQLVGVAIAAAGLILIAAALDLFRRNRTSPEPWRPASKLVATGLYRWTRNPMYLGMSVTSAGVAIFFESLAAAVLLAIVVLVMDRVVIAREEAYLSRKFGADYDSYRGRVRRWL